MKSIFAFFEFLCTTWLAPSTILVSLSTNVRTKLDLHRVVRGSCILENAEATLFFIYTVICNCWLLVRLTKEKKGVHANQALRHCSQICQTYSIISLTPVICSAGEACWEAPTKWTLNSCWSSFRGRFRMVMYVLLCLLYNFERFPDTSSCHISSMMVYSGRPFANSRRGFGIQSRWHCSSILGTKPDSTSSGKVTANRLPATLTNLSSCTEYLP